ncbi:YqaJ viral recombinase family protein [Kiloniella antarctica]|uniref:YqaJ viral recombinase family protein n=1 Tax=Kiloniella antarctica TaxID=1550907 RepID=A0ABW5BPC3_9PROT
MSNIPHSERIKYIGASEVAAVFNLSPFLTKFELWHRKAGSIEEGYLEDSRIQWGNILERPIATATAEKTGWTIHKVHRYLTHKTVEGMGASPDFEIIGHERGPGALEIKTVDWMVFKDWPDAKPPIYYQLQLQQQLSVMGRSWGAIAVLIGGNQLEVFEYKRHAGTVKKIEQGITEFWQSIRDNKEPLPDFRSDADTIALLYGSGRGEAVNMRGDNYLTELCARYHEASSRAKEWDKERKAAKAEILTKIGDASIAFVDEFRLLAGEVKSVELAAHTRRGFRNLNVTPLQKEAAE